MAPHLLLAAIVLSILAAGRCDLQREALTATTTIDAHEHKYLITNIISKQNARSRLECQVKCLRLADCDTNFFDEDNSKCYLVASSAVNGSAVLVQKSLLSVGTFSRSEPLEYQYVHRLSASCPNTKTCSSAGTARVCDKSTEQCQIANEEACTHQPFANTKYYYNWPGAASSITNGSFGNGVLYNKKKADTAVQVSWRGSLMGGYSGSASMSNCTRWFVTFNGAECSAPAKVEYLQYMSPSNMHLDIEAAIDGVCENLPQGSVLIELRVGACSGYAAGSVTSFSPYTPRLTVREVAPASAKTCAIGPVFNARYSTWTNLDATATNQTVLWMSYNKMLPETSLKVTFTGILWQPNPSIYTRFSIQFNGADCPQKAIDGVVYHNAGVQISAYLNGILEGTCGNLAAGSHNISLRIIPYSTSDYQPAKVGWKSVVRMAVEEFRTDNVVNAVQMSDGTLQYASVQNRVVLNGALLSWSYTKAFTQTALRVSWTGTVGFVSTTPSATLSLLFNGVACPAKPIDTSFSLTTNVMSMYRPMQVDGICESLAAGPLTISLQHSASASIGYGSSAPTIIIEEVFLGQ